MSAHMPTSSRLSQRPAKTYSFANSSPIYNLKTRTSPDYAVPRCANWVFAAGGTRSVSFDFERDTQRQIAESDELNGATSSGEEYYLQKAFEDIMKPSVPSRPIIPVYNTPPQFMYPSQRKAHKYRLNFERPTPGDVKIMNSALPFSPDSTEQPHKHVIQKAGVPTSIPPHISFGPVSMTFGDTSQSQRHSTCATPSSRHSRPRPPYRA